MGNEPDRYERRMLRDAEALGVEHSGGRDVFHTRVPHSVWGARIRLGQNTATDARDDHHQMTKPVHCHPLQLTF
jgi:hypothetical protein